MVFCILIFGLERAQVIDVAANLTESCCVLCWWSASLHNQVEGVCVWLILPVRMPSFNACACVFFKVLLLFRITWLVRKCLPVCVFVSFAEKTESVPEKLLLWGNWIKQLFDLEIGLQLCKHAPDNNVFADWYFIQSHHQIAKAFGEKDASYLLQ